MRRIEAISAALKAAVRDHALLICNLGLPSRELYSLGDRPENFYMLGSMGLASSIGLGLSLARPGRRVMVLEGDGSLLMNLGSLATIANHAPENYLLVVLDNCCYGSTGCQPTCTQGRSDLADLARAAGVRHVCRVTEAEDLDRALSGQGVVVARVQAGNEDVPIIDIPPEEILERFMRSALQAG